jgi:hypothetical protein
MASGFKLDQGHWFSLLRAAMEFADSDLSSKIWEKVQRSEREEKTKFCSLST